MSKLSEGLTQFAKDVSKLSPADQQKLYAAIQASFGPVTSTRTTRAGEVVETRDVNFDVIREAVPPDLRQDWRQIERDLNDAGKKHGNQWADESYAYILSRYLLPQPTPGERLVTPDVVAALEKAGFTRGAAAPAPSIDDIAEAVLQKLVDGGKLKPTTPTAPATPSTPTT